MIYLDYSATTPVNDEVIDTYVKVTKNFIGNPNSLHKLGIDAKELIDASTNQIKKVLKIENSDVIYTSGATEANNLAIKGVCFKYKNRGKHIITTRLEHHSVIEAIKSLEQFGFTYEYVNLDCNGLVDLKHLDEIITDDTVLVSIAAVNSELGIIQPVEKISNIVKKHQKCYFHSDVTQAIGKIEIDLNLFDMASFSGQKFYSMKGIGCLIKKSNIIIDILINGGKSTTIYRGGTPPVALIASLAKGLRLVYNDFTKKYNLVCSLHDYLLEELKKLEIYINSNDYSVPHIINFSLKDIKSETMLHALEQKEIYISTKTACSSDMISDAVMAIYNDEDRAKTSMRISLSFLTTTDEIDEFVKIFKDCLSKLHIKNKGLHNE